MIRRPPRSTRTATLFPYTSLFPSAVLAGLCAAAIAGVLSRPHGLCPVSPSAPGNNLGAEVMTTTLCTDSPSGKRYDLAVIGAGSAGFSAAIPAAEAGAQVALIGHGFIGGPCEIGRASGRERGS